jgi:hypothetical protein
MPWKLPIVDGDFVCPKCDTKEIIIGAAFKAVIEDEFIICKELMGVNEFVFCDNCQAKFEVPERIRNQVKEFRGE